MSKQSGAEKKSIFKDQRVLLGIVIIAIIAVVSFINPKLLQ